MIVAYGRSTTVIPLLSPTEFAYAADGIRERLGPSVVGGAVSADFRFLYPLRNYALHLSLVDRLRPYRGAGRLLEIACGPGLCLHAAALDGWDVTGVEPSEALAAYARRNLGLDVQAGPPTTLPHPPAVFDVAAVHAHPALVFTPHEMLRELARVLRPGGTIFLSAPNSASLRHQLGDREGVWGLTVGALTTAFAETGFRIGQVGYAGEAVADVVDHYACDRAASLRIERILARTRQWESLGENIEMLAHSA